MKRFLLKIIDYLFYNLLTEVIEEEFSIDIFLKIENEIIKELKMKYVPTRGDFIEFTSKKNESSFIFEVEKVLIMQYGAVAYLTGKLIS